MEAWLMSWRWSRGMKEVRQQAPQVPREGLPGRRKEECKGPELGHHGTSENKVADVVKAE